MRFIAIAGIAAVLAACGDDGSSASPDASAPGTPDASVNPAADASSGSDAQSPVLSAVVPDTGRPGRTIDVVVLVDHTTIDADMTSLDLGAGITVDSATALSSTAISARLIIAEDATVGPRDVSLTGGGNTLTGSGAFTVAHALNIDITAGTPVQGGVVEMTVSNLDTESFLPQFVFDGGMWIADEAERGPSHWRGIVAIDPLAPTMAPFGVTQTTATFEPVQRFTAELVAVAPRAPTNVPLTIAGGLTTLTGEVIAASMTTNVYKISTSEAGIVVILVDPHRFTMISPVVSVLPQSGTYAEVIASGAGRTILLEAPATATDFYVVVGDENQGGGAVEDYGFDFYARLLTSVEVSEQVAPHDSQGTAQAISRSNIVRGELAAGDGQDVYILSPALAAVVTLHTDADLELSGSCNGATATDLPTSRPYNRAVTFSAPVSGGSGGTCVLIVRARSGPIGRPTGTYTIITR